MRNLCTLISVGAMLAACAPANHHPNAPTPNRTTESLGDEMRARRADLIDAVRLEDLDRLRRSMAPNVVLIRPSGDTVRGVEEVGKDLIRLRASLPIEVVRGIPMTGAVRCFDGVLERKGEWSLTLLGADSVRRFLRGPFSIHWTTRGDSIAVGMIDLTSTPLTNDERMGCANVDLIHYANRRVEAFYSMGISTPSSFFGSANRKLLKAGYTRSNSPDQITYSDGDPPRAAQMVGVSGRLTDRFWVTAAAPVFPERSSIGRCNIETFNHVGLKRERQPFWLSLDARLPHNFRVGAGPVFTRDHYRYKEVDFSSRPPDQTEFFGRCSAVVVVTPHDSIETTVHRVGEGANLGWMMSAGSHGAILFRAQVVRFPSAPGFVTSRGMSLSFRDLTTTIGVGMMFSY